MKKSASVVYRGAGLPRNPSSSSKSDIEPSPGNGQSIGDWIGYRVTAENSWSGNNRRPRNEVFYEAVTFLAFGVVPSESVIILRHTLGYSMSLYIYLRKALLRIISLVWVTWRLFNYFTVSEHGRPTKGERSIHRLLHHTRVHSASFSQSQKQRAPYVRRSQRSDLRSTYPQLFSNEILKEDWNENVPKYLQSGLARYKPQTEAAGNMAKCSESSIPVLAWMSISFQRVRFSVWSGCIG